MLNAARAHGMPTMEIAMMTAASSQPAVIAMPPKMSHSRMSRMDTGDIARSRHSGGAGSGSTGCDEDGDAGGDLPAVDGRRHPPPRMVRKPPSGQHQPHAECRPAGERRSSFK